MSKAVKVTFSVKEETKDAIYSLYNELKEQQIIGTFDDYINELIDTYKSKRVTTTKLEQQIKELQEELTQAKELSLQAVNSEDLQKEIEHLQEVNKRETECKQQAYDELTDLKQAYETLYNNFIHVSVEKEPGIIIVDFGNYKTLITTTVQRLNKKYNRTDITPDQLLFTMFMRYTVEKLTNIFYPFVLSDKEIEEITGKSIRDIRQFLKQ